MMNWPVWGLFLICDLIENYRTTELVEVVTRVTVFNSMDFIYGAVLVCVSVYQVFIWFLLLSQNVVAPTPELWYPVSQSQKFKFALVMFLTDSWDTGCAKMTTLKPLCISFLTFVFSLAVSESHCGRQQSNINFHCHCVSFLCTKLNVIKIIYRCYNHLLKYSIADSLSRWKLEDTTPIFVP